ncbi:MAG: alkylation response protein AidB-like acyl-CoA dehydrogenase [Flavobacteriales bacterium]|jgi:alkylation response protein AidB-like acyl-CoA dehydrogenase
MNQPKSQAPFGCSFLIHPTGTEVIFTSERFDDEQRMFAASAKEFMDREVLPHIAAFERQDGNIMADTIKKAGEAGLLMVDIPEAYGGLGLDKATSMLVAEALSTYASYSVSHGGHVGIGTLPLLYFGNEEQKQRYLPRLASGELLAAYALTEPGSGSDALGAKTTAVLETSDDGDRVYRLNGTKMWITNAGFADLFTVFAKVDGEKFSAFLIEATVAGVSTGAEEHKMGLKGSSTRMLILDDVVVPESALLGEVGRGHKIAFNILNVGRFKLGVGAIGGCKRTLQIAAEYANTRHQFGQPIGSFGAIQQKLAQMATRIFSLESMCYRVGGYMDDTIEPLDNQAPDYSAKVMAAIEAFAVEDSIIKVFGSEVADFVADEAVQIHGGYGYSSEYEVERTYRDSRINRIFEGTNEINRLLIPGIMLKRTMQQQLPLFSVVGEATAITEAAKERAPACTDSTLDFEQFTTQRSKLMAVYVANLAIQRHLADFKDQQQLMLALADLIIGAYEADSTVTRVQQMMAAGQATPVHLMLAKLTTARVNAESLRIATELAPSLVEEDELETYVERIRKFAYAPRLDTVRARRQVAAAVLDMPKWSFS